MSGGAEIVQLSQGVDKQSGGHKNKRKRVEVDSPDLDNSFTEQERIKLEDLITKMSEMITELADRAKNMKAKELQKEVEKLGVENKSILVEEVLPILAKDKARKIDFVLERQYCSKCEIEISREEEEKRLIIEQVEEAEEMEEEEFSKFLEMKWPEEAFKKTNLVTGNVLSFKEKELVVFVENCKEESNLLGLLKNRFPEVDEILTEEDSGGDSIPFLDNIIKTKKGTTNKRIYFVKVGTNKEMKENVFKIRNECDSRTGLAVAVSTFKNRVRVRKALEVMFCGKDYNIDFYIPESDLKRERDSSRTRGGKVRSEAVVIETNVSTYADTLRNIRAVVDLDKLGVEVKTVKATKDKKMVIVTEEGQAEMLHKEISAKVTGVESRVTGVGRERYTPLLVLDIDASINGKEVEDFIRRATKVYGTEIKSLRMGRAGTQIAVVHMPVGAAEELLNSGDIKIGWTRCRVKPKIDVLKCFNCLKLGHHSDICKEERTGRKCINCTQEGHLIRDCTNQSFCPMCERAGHRSDSTFCPSYRMRYQEAAEQWRMESKRVENGVLSEHKGEGEQSQYMEVESAAEKPDE